MSWKRLAAFVVVEAVALTSFYKGFFPSLPVDETRNSIAKSEALLKPFMPEDCSWNLSSALSEPVIERTIFVLIDALRSDFALGRDSPMRFVRQKLAEGRGYATPAHTQAPTVTMPRIKALTTGSVPSFLDAALNLASSELRLDSWVAQARYSGRRLRFFGDDTWLNLFPQAFDRSEGVTSFFVSDYTEVDDNVTRHLPRLFAEASEWDLAVLHYLGLDHIGHSFGPRHPLLPRKLAEMDEILQRLWEGLEAVSGNSKAWAIVLVGDHGMSEVGSHGGASPAETSVPLILLSPATSPSASPSPSSRSVEQIDVVPLLSALWGLATPKPSLGVLPPQGAEAFLPDTQRLLRHALGALEMACNKGRGLPEDMQARLGLSLKRLCRGEVADELEGLVASLDSFAAEIREDLLVSAAEHSLPLMLLGCSAALALVVLSLGKQSRATLLVTSLSAVGMASSSFIEEEHQTWYFLYVTLVLLRIGSVLGEAPAKAKLKSRLKSIAPFVGVLCLHRLLRAWNQTGDKWAHLPDISDALMSPELGWLLSPLATASLVFVFLMEMRS